MFDKYSEILKKLPPIVGIAPNAFSRTVPAAFLKDYSIVCFKWRAETSYIEKDIDVFSVEKLHPEIKVGKTNAMEILNLKPVQHFIAKKPGASLLVYKSTKGIEKLAKRYGWQVLGNDTKIKSPFENKKVFREVLLKAKIDPIPGESFKFDDLNEEKFRIYKEKYGLPLVFQIAEMTEGGGTGTAFIESELKLKQFVERILEKRDKKLIENVNVTKFVKGIPTSIAACVTSKGIITGRIQTQIQDIPDVRTLNEGSGLFCGHDWSFRNYDENLQKQAREIATKFGTYIGKLGYKGIFGLDLITNEEEGKVYPIECNPRYTDAFPVLSMMHLEKGIIPMDFYHILENLNVSYDFNIEKVSESYNVPLSGSQIILETKSKHWTKSTGEIKAGVYTINQNGELEFVRSGYQFQDLKNENEYLITEGVPSLGTVFKPGARVLRLVSKKAMLAEMKELTMEIKNVIEKIYEKVKLVEIPDQDPKLYAD